MLYTPRPAGASTTIASPSVVDPQTPPRTFKWPLRFLLTVPIVLPLMVAVGIVGFLSWRSGQMAIDNLADQLMTQVGDRTVQDLAIQTSLPPKLVAWIAKDIELGRIQSDPVHFKELDRYFLSKSSTFPEVSFMAVGTVHGHSMSVSWFAAPGEAPEQRLEVADGTIPGQSLVFAPGPNGQRGAVIERRSDMDVRQLAWYQAGLASQIPTWTPPYSSSAHPGGGFLVARFESIAGSSSL
jgi:hypothetical protein